VLVGVVLPYVGNEDLECEDIRLPQRLLRMNAAKQPPGIDRAEFFPASLLPLTQSAHEIRQIMFDDVCPLPHLLMVI
jgi:hypothetical protein